MALKEMTLFVCLISLFLGRQWDWKARAFHVSELLLSKTRLIWQHTSLSLLIQTDLFLSTFLHCLAKVTKKERKEKCPTLSLTFFVVREQCVAWTLFTTLHFGRNLQMGPNKLECYIIKDFKGFPRTKNLANLAHS